MENYKLTTLTPELIKDIFRYTKETTTHGVTEIHGFQRGLYRTMYNGEYIYYDLDSVNVLRSVSNEIKLERKDATTKTD